MVAGRMQTNHLYETCPMNCWIPDHTAQILFLLKTDYLANLLALLQILWTCKKYTHTTKMHNYFSFT